MANELKQVCGGNGRQGDLRSLWVWGEWCEGCGQRHSTHMLTAACPQMAHGHEFLPLHVAKVEGCML